MIMKLFISSILLVYCNAQVDRDWSFQAMCTFWDGKGYRPRDGGFDALDGDKCDFQLPMETDSPESALRYCEDQVPYHILKAKPGSPTVCSAEATLICKSGWVQLFGRCYKLEKKHMMTHGEAVDYCAKLKSEVNGADVHIAFMHRETLPFRINDYFTRVSSVWMDASESITNDLIYNKENGNLLLALDGYKYNLPNIALARVDPSEKAMALCEYTPSMNRAESNYLLKKYGKIYYPTISTSEGSFVRTASSLHRNRIDSLAEANYCTKMMAPFIPNGLARSAFPTDDFLHEVNKAGKGFIIRMATVSMNAQEEERKKATCTSYKGAIHQMLYKSADGTKISQKIPTSAWRDSEPRETCDAGSWSSALVTGRDGNPGLEATSDARFAPIYCQNIVQSFTYGDCPDGFTPYFRKSLGQKWCHRFFPGVYKTYDDAEKHCQSYGAHLTGYTDQEEFKLLADLHGTNYGDWYKNETWLGARRREQCNKMAGGDLSKEGYVKDANDQCSRVRVYEWMEGVAPNPPDIETNWNNDVEPNFMNTNEKCLSLMVRADRKTINDIRCDKEFKPMCGLEAPIVMKS
ncbi:unnamed protein product [Caenorhabditis nigoni]